MGYKIICGVSTADAVTDISGRGVGLDAVKSYVERIGGSVGIVSQGPVVDGQMPIAFQVKIPLKAGVKSSA